MNPVELSVRVVCGQCGGETELFKATLDPMEISSLGRAEARVDREIGAGIEAKCAACVSPCTIVRTYIDDLLQEECSVSEFAAKYDELGREDRPGYG